MSNNDVTESKINDGTSTDGPGKSEPEGGARLIGLVPDIEPGARRILDFGCAAGDTLMQLKEERGCSELYGVEIKEEYRPQLEERLDGFWFMDLGEDGTHLGDEFRGFFNYILMLDVVEHLYDPWYVVPQLSQYLAPDGLLIVSVPNLRYWGLWYNIVLGTFPYGQGGGLMNEEHIRWFTGDSLRELVIMSGLEVVNGRLAFPPDINVDMMHKNLASPISELELPPKESAITSQKVVLRFPNLDQINAQYPHFLANKVILVCKRKGDPVIPVHLKVGELEQRKRRVTP